MRFFQLFQGSNFGPKHCKNEITGGLYPSLRGPRKKMVDLLIPTRIGVCDVHKYFSIFQCPATMFWNLGDTIHPSRSSFNLGHENTYVQQNCLTTTGKALKLFSTAWRFFHLLCNIICLDHYQFGTTIVEPCLVLKKSSTYWLLVGKQLWCNTHITSYCCWFVFQPSVVWSNVQITLS